ncbi:MAG: response regulator, partial [bacterium]
EGENLKPEATFHDNQKLVALFLKGCEEFPCRVGEGIIGTVVSTGKPLLTSRPFSEEIHEFAQTPFCYVQQNFSISSLMLLPLRVRDHIIGAMVFLFGQSKRKYKDEELKLAQELANRAALAIENARLFREAGQKAKELEKANKLKTEFLANVSHELRTPLNAIITLSDILIRGIPGNVNAEQLKQLQIIQRSGRNLLNLINDILDLSKIESGRVEPIYSMIPIRAVVEETVEHIRPLCRGKGLSLEYEYTNEVPEFIYSDQDKLTKALMNILSNAVKFTPKGKINVLMSLADKSNLKIEVSDTGIGIPQDRFEEIFKEFRQIDSSDSRAYGGTGLGLAITRNVLEIIGGTVSVESQLGKGSTFTIVVPFQLKEELTHKKIVDFEQRVPKKVADEFEIELTDDRDRLDKHKKSVLVIDDEKEAIYVMRQYLHEHGYQIICPRPGEDILELTKRFNPCAIALDILMPEQNGWEFLDVFKQDLTTRKIPIIITSILSEKERAFEMGASEYLVKPFNPKKLIAFLNNLEPERAIKKKKVILDLPKFLNFKKLTPKRLFTLPGRRGNGADAKSKILLVDDDKDTQYAMQYLLEEVGYKVYFASEGREALKQAEAIRPNLILMDIMMPKMDGYEATRRLKSNVKFKNIPIIAMTAKAMKGDREQAFVAGCDDYIAKPFMSKEILQMVEKWINESQVIKLKT